MGEAHEGPGGAGARPAGLRVGSPGDIVVDLLFGQNGPLGRLARGVPDAAGGAAQQGIWLVPTLLEPGQHDDAQEVAEVEAVCCRIKATVDAKGPKRNAQAGLAQAWG